MKKRCFIYARVSTRTQAEEGYSIPEQLERLNKYADAMDWLVAEVYVDPGYSGATTSRPGLQELVANVDNADIVLVDKLDRLSRSLQDTLYLINTFKQHDAAFVSRAEAFDTSSAFGRATVGILAVFAELEREKIKERTHDGLVGRAKAGLWHGTAPTGYYKSTDKETAGILIKDEHENMQVREAGIRTLNREPLIDIVNSFNEKGYRIKGKPWTVTTLRRMLQKRAYLGEVPFAGEWYPGLHEPTFTVDEFNGIQQVLYERSIKNEHYMPGKKYTAPLGGLLYCKQCGAKYHYRKAHSDPKRLDGSSRSYRYGYYMCYSRSKCDKKLVRDPNCRNLNYRDTELDDIVYSQIDALADNPQYIDGLRKSVDTTKKQAALKTRIDQISGQLSRLMDLYAAGNIPYELIGSKIEPLNAEKQALQSELSDLQAQTKIMSTEDIVSLATQFCAVRASGTPAEIHQALCSIVDYVEVDDNNILVHWRF